MPLFQNSVVKEYITKLDDAKVESAWKKFQSYFLNLTRQKNIITQKEEQFQEGFLRELFVNVLGYTINPDPNYNLITELKNEKDSKKADGAIVSASGVVAVIELKSTRIADLNRIEIQAFAYKNNQQNCRFVITSNFQKVRFYIDNTIENVEWDLFKLGLDEFRFMYLCLSAETLLNNVPADLKEASITREEAITKQLYNEYSLFRKELFQNIISINGFHDKLLLFKKTQKLLDRFLFLFFAEDRLLVPPNSVRTILAQWTELKEKFDEYQPLYDRFKKYFAYLDKGHKGSKHEIFAYNGGLFETDQVLDSIKIDDTILYNATFSLSRYDYNSEIDVNILGHIFEHSLTEIEELEKQITNGDQSVLQKISRRKKDGVFYTPRYITKYIVENTVGILCNTKKEALNLQEEEYYVKQTKKKKKALLSTLEEYRQWLLHITILDPACGSGAFLNQALEFLIEEHKWINDLEARLTNSAIVFDVENSILENNLFGVDINEESVEIAKLSLWLRTAQKGRKLTTLNDNIKCGNSLIDDKKVAGDKAFNWETEFKSVFGKGGFDIVIGNPPYGIIINQNEIDYLNAKFPLTTYKTNLYVLFLERMFQLFRKSHISFIIPKSLLFNSYYSTIRKFLIENSQLVEFFTITEKVFQDAEVGGSLILNFRINSEEFSIDNLTRLVSVDSYFEYPQKATIANVKQSYFLGIPNIEISITHDNLFSIKEKILQLKPIDNYFRLKNGLNPGNIKHILISTSKESGKHKPIIWGKDIAPFVIRWSGSYINYDENIAENLSVDDIRSKEGMKSQTKIDFALRDKEIFETSKVLVRKTGDKLIAAVDHSHYYFDTLVHGIYRKENSFSLESLVLILNSKVATQFYRILHDIEGKVFAKISLDKLASFPIPFVDEGNDSIMTLLHNKSTDLRKQSELLSRKLNEFIKAKLNTEELMLANIAGLTEADFLKKLKKYSKNMSLSEQKEWLMIFSQEKEDISNVHKMILETDKIIENLVCTLYGLKDEEIQILKKEDS